MKVTRRALVAAALAPAAVAQNPAPPAADPVQAARDRIKANAEILAKIDIPMSTEPAFHFEA